MRTIAFEHDIKTALSGVATKHGVKIEDDLMQMVIRTIAKQISEGAEKVADFKRYCTSYGLKPEHLGATFQSGRDTFKITGLVPSRPKYPISAVNVRTGRQFKFSQRMIPFATQPVPLFGSAPVTGAPKRNMGTCENDNAFDRNWNPVGHCGRPATTTRKIGFGASATFQKLCDDCANAHDESMREQKAEARMS
jgi:hypothetical protein